MKTLFLGSSVLSTGGGQKVTRVFASELSKESEVHILTTQNDKRIQGKFKSNENVEIHTNLPPMKVSEPSLSDIPSIIIIQIILFYWAMKIIRKYSVDVVYVLSYKYLLTASFVAKIYKTLVVARLTSFITEEYKSWMNFSTFIALSLLEKATVILSFVDLVQVDSNRKKLYLESYTNGKVKIIPNPIDITKIEIIKKNTNIGIIRNNLDATEKTLLTFAGRLAPIKSVGEFVKCLPELEIDYKFVIIGDGPEKEEIGKIVKNLNLEDKVSILGHKEHSEVLSIIRSSDCVIIPSKMDKGLNTILESLALNIPVITRGSVKEFEKKSNNLHFVQRIEDIVPKITRGINKEKDDDIIKEHSRESAYNSFRESISEILEK